MQERPPHWTRFVSIGVRPGMSFDLRRRLYVVNGAAIATLTLATIFLALNLAAGHFHLALTNLVSVSIAAGALLLIHFGRHQVGIALLIAGMTAHFTATSLLFHNGVDLYLLLCASVPLLVLDSVFWRRAVASVAGIAFLAVQLHHVAHPVPPGVTLTRFAINLAVFVVSLYAYNALFRSLHDQALGLIVEKNAQLEQQRLLLEAEHAKLMDRTQQLDEANAAKEKLFSVVGHDLRGPVANVRQSLDMLKDGSMSPAEFRELLPALREEIDHVQGSLENLMEWAAAQMDSLRPRVGSAPLRHTAEQTAGLLSGIAREKGIAVENELPEGATVLADPHQLQSIFRNLLGNALKFTPTGGRVNLSAREQNGAWRITVRDNGVGMEPALASRLFEDGERRSTRGTANEKGLGLGLQICRDFVRAHGGTIAAESEPGKGSSFHVTLPKA